MAMVEQRQTKPVSAIRALYHPKINHLHHSPQRTTNGKSRSVKMSKLCLNNGRKAQLAIYVHCIDRGSYPS
jgi:hypothetical protein